jgi:hypothetical protein
LRETAALSEVERQEGGKEPRLPLARSAGARRAQLELVLGAAQAQNEVLQNIATHSIPVATAVLVRWRRPANQRCQYNIRALTQARLDFVAVLARGAQGRGGLLGDLLVQTTGNVQVLLATVLDTVAKLGADLEAKLKVQSAAIVGQTSASTRVRPWIST